MEKCQKCKIKLLIVTTILITFFNTPIFAVSIDDLNKTVVFIRQQSQKIIQIDGKPANLYYRNPESKEYKPIMETSLGTGFLITFNGRDYLVTAKHVANTLLPTGEVIMNLPNNKIAIVTFQQLVEAKIIKGAHWFHHPKADISIHPMFYPFMVDAAAIPEEFYPRVEPDVKLLSPAYVVGFPLGLGLLDKLSPVAKEAKIASRLTSIADPNIPNDLHFYLLDQALSQGYSGAPVFYVEDIMSGVSIGNQRMKGGEILHLLGVQSSALSDQTGGKISIVVPISYIRDILESTDFQAYIKGLEPNKK
jgi:S1-C subfamily serine protease